MWWKHRADSRRLRDVSSGRLRPGARLFRMPARTQIYRRHDPRSRDRRDARLDFRYRKVGGSDCWPKNCGSTDQQKHARGSRENPKWKVRARIHSRDGDRATALSRPVATGAAAVHRKDWATLAGVDELAKKINDPSRALRERVAAATLIPAAILLLRDSRR